MRRFLPVILVLAFVAAACGDDNTSADADGDGDASTSTTVTTTAAPASTDPPPSTTEALSSTTTEPPTTTTTTTVVDGGFGPGPPLPRLLVANGTQIDLVETSLDHDVKTTPVLTARGTVTAIRQARDGTIVTHESVDEDTPFELEVARYAPDGTRTVVDGATRLYDVALVNGTESMIVRGEGDEFGAASILSIPLDGSAPTNLGPASDIEFGVGVVDVFDGLAVISATADLTEVVAYIELGGTEPAWSPTDDLPYGEPPLVVAASFGFDGTRLYWAEGPDWGFIEEEDDFGPIPGVWEVFGADLASGETTLIWPVSGVVADSAEMFVASIIDVDTHLIVNRSMFTPRGEVMLAPMIVDFTLEEPGSWELPVRGVATLAVA